MRVPFGIYRFRESGFWKQGLSSLNHTERKVRPFLSPREHIQGLYLMGSSGTLAQTQNSDFDYWVVVEEEGMGPESRQLLEKKLRGIETHCKDRHGQAVTFFVLDAAQVRENRFDIMDEESSGSAQRTLLKEEFYRSFIMIAGKIPYWAVCPVALDDGQYQDLIGAACRGRHLRFLPEDYIDLGNLAVLNRRESLGALLWQIYKARHSPFKSMIKAALIGHYYYFEEDGFLCDTVKQRFLEERPGASLLDPYALMFEKGLSFFEGLEDTEGLDLMRRCIFFRLGGGRPVWSSSGDTPKGRLLRQLIQRWGWGEKRIHHLQRYGAWPEAEKLQLERAIFDKISFIYDLVRRGRDGAAIEMTDRDLNVLVNRIAVHFRRKTGKIPHCSSHAKLNAPAFQLIVAGRGNAGEASTWSVYGRERQRSLDRDALLFQGPELLKITAWLILNGFYSGRKSPVGFQATPGCGVTGSQAQRLVRGTHDFFKESLATLTVSHQPPSWKRAMVCLHRTDDGGGRPVCADFLVLNSWGELFFDVLSLNHLDSEALACYGIAEHIWIFSRGRPSLKLPFRLVRPNGSEDGVAAKTVDNYLAQMAENARARSTPETTSPTDSADGPDNGLILDT